MKNNTIAIALGSLLLGGVATAGYLNNRDKTSDIQPPSDAAAAQYADAFGEPLPMDTPFGTVWFVPAAFAVPAGASRAIAPASIRPMTNFFIKSSLT